MKILHGVNDLHDAGNGIINHVVDLACQQALDNDVGILSRGGAFEDVVQSNGVRTERVELARRPLSLLRAVRHARALLKSGVDVAHAHTVTTFAVFYVARIGVRPHPRLVSTIHNSWQRGFWLMTFGDQVIAVSDAEGRRLRRLIWLKHKVAVVRNCVIDGVRMRAQGTASRQLDRPSITTVAGLYHRKGIHDLLRAFAAVHPDFNAHLNVVGDGPNRQELQGLATELGLDDRVTFAGFDPRPLEWLRATDIFVLASHAEPGGLVIDEARYAGCAVIATDVGGNPDRVDGGGAATLVPPSRPDRLAAELERLLDSEEALSDAKAASANGLTNLTVAAMASATIDVYRG